MGHLKKKHKKTRNLKGPSAAFVEKESVNTTYFKGNQFDGDCDFIKSVMTHSDQK